MGRDGLLIGELAARSGVSRKALRLYEANGILPPPRRTASGYRMYEPDTLRLLDFVKQAQRLGFRLEEIKEIVAMRRSGRAPCAHVRTLVERKTAELERILSDAREVHDRLKSVVKAWSSTARQGAVVCPHIETQNAATTRRTRWKR